MLGISTLFPALILIVAAFGFGVLLLNRRRAGSINVPPKPVTPPRPTPPSAQEADAEQRAADSGPAEVGAAGAPARQEPADDAQVVDDGHDVAPVLERPRFRDRLSRARAGLTGAMLGVRGLVGITQDTWDDLEEALIKADLGVRVTDELLDGLRARVKSKEIADPDALVAALKAEMLGRLEGADRSLTTLARGAGQPDVWLFVGVNGVGKTTTIGKIGARETAAGRKVLMAAGDTFRAAAAEQLSTWADRSGAEFVRGNEGGDPSAVIFDGVQAAAARGCDLVLGDTAGRLHNKSNLMDELRKVRRVADRDPGQVSEVLLVIDATTGQNGLTQAREFREATEVTGVVLTKLDGSAKGGIVFAIETELGIPIKLVGLGETIADLVEFDPVEFVDALFDET